MFAPASSEAGVVMAVATLLCFGSWSNSIKATQHAIAFPGFYFDVIAGIFLASLVCAGSLGMMQGAPGTFLEDLRGGCGIQPFLFASLAGAVFNIGNILIGLGILHLGLAVGVTIGIGTVLVLSQIIGYVTNPEGNLLLLIIGLLFGVIAMLLNGVVSFSKEKGRRRSSSDACDTESVGSNFILPEESQVLLGSSMLTQISIVVSGGIIFSLWPLIFAKALDTDLPHITPYTGFVCYSLAAAVTTPVYFFFLLRCTRLGFKQRKLRDVFVNYRKAPCLMHLYGVLGGFTLQIGNECFGLAQATSLGFTAFGIGQCAPMISMLWGIFYFGEMRGTSTMARLLVLPVMVCFLACISLLILSRNF